MKVYFKTFGCRTNIYDSEVMKSSLKDGEICYDENAADVIVVNSCTVTNGADSDVRSYINKMNRLGKRVLFTGCGSKDKGSELFKNGKVFGVFSMSKRASIDKFISQTSKFIDLNESGNSINSSPVLSNFTAHTKAFVKIQEGCNFECSYCIIPSVRGRAISRDESEILKEVESLTQNGFSEVVLTGTNIGSYGRDSGSNLARLLKKISLIKGVKRVRLGSLEPSQIDDEFREILCESWLEKHLHIALQHTSEKMLRLMKRRNRALKDIALFEELSLKGFALGTDFIVGHPGESAEIWDEALRNFKNFPLTHIHAFIYSKRDGTHSEALASKLGEINGAISKDRLKTIQNIVKENNFKFRQKNAKIPLEILVEQSIAENFSGFDQFYNRVFIKSSKNLINSWIKVGEYEVKDSGNFAKY